MAAAAKGTVWDELTAEERIRLLELDLAEAEAQIEAQQRQLIAAGVLDPELGP
jgi:hypothetical protein